MRLTIVVGTVTGGVGAHVRSMIPRLGHLGLDVSVAGPAESQENLDFTGAGARFLPVPIGSAPNPPADLAAARRLRQVFDGADVVHAHGFRATALSGLALGRRRRGRTPLLSTWHNAVLGGGPRRVLLAGLERLAARRADVTLGASSDLVARARQLGAPDARPMFIAAPVGAPPSRNQEAVREELGVGERPLVLAVSRLAEQKGLDVLLAAAALWRDRRSETSAGDRSAPGAGGESGPVLVIAGDGPDRQGLQEVIDRDGLDVRLLGRRDDVPDLLAAADLYVLTSVWEARPLVIQEAMRAGLPVVATAVGGVPELVGDGAELVPVGDAAAVASAVTALLDDPRRRADLVARADRQVADWPDEDDNARQIAQLCQHLAATPPG